jgi:septum formation protein
VTVRASGAPELEQGEPRALTLANARAKADAVAGPEEGELLIACDTVVELDGRIYGKPATADHARETLLALSGRTHTVHSGLILRIGGSGERSASAGTQVSFRELGSSLIDWYLATGEWRSRAGGYAIQGSGAALVREVRGDYENVVGLPLAALLDLYPELLAPA